MQYGDFVQMNGDPRALGRIIPYRPYQIDPEVT